MMLGIYQRVNKSKESRKVYRGFIHVICTTTGCIVGGVIIGTGFYTLVSFAFMGYMISKVIGCIFVPDKTIIEYVDSGAVIVQNPDE